MFQPKMILFDLDGTLIDSVPDLAFCINSMLSQLDMATVPDDSVRNWVGNGIQRLVERALSNDLDAYPETDLLERAMPIFMELYAANTSQRSYLYEGVLDALDYLQSCPNIQLGCVTNKAEQFTLPLLRDQGIAERFEIIISGDSLPEKKPHPLPLLHAAKRLGVTPTESLMVGDSKSDVKAARAAGFQVICTTYGYNHGEDIRHYKPDAVVDSLAELKTLIA
ncbi:MAG: phosphoglycolate phosphatase [Proteobacteria bacterium]|nr:MAG: phosphoglycolate phosphatase [Pseudomonadota bacterium]